MLYLERFEFPDAERETEFFISCPDAKRRCYASFYPFQVLPAIGLTRLEFEPITLLCGGNGCGKTTALNVIAEKLALRRDTLHNRSAFFEHYTALCSYRTRADIPPESAIVTSDDVFDFMLDLRSLNEGIDRKREELFDDYLSKRVVMDESKRFQLRSMDDYEELRSINLARSATQSKYVRKHLMKNARTHSNGESALMYFQSKIKENSLYLLDEPENSLSPEKQLELLRFIEESVRFFGCQFIIATHSPFILSLRGARIYHLDESPARVRKWTELPNVRMWHDFFEARRDEF